MSVKSTTFGAKLQWDNGGFTDIAAVLRIGDVNIVTKDFVDVTTHDSPNRYREFLPTLNDTDEFEVEILLDESDAGHQHLLAVSGAMTSESWKIIYPDPGSTEWTFTASISSLTVSEATVDGTFNAVISFKRTSGIPLQA